jgi:hypothetical protein
MYGAAPLVWCVPTSSGERRTKQDGVFRAGVDFTRRLKLKGDSKPDRPFLNPHSTFSLPEWFDICYTYPTAGAALAVYNLNEPI